MVSHETMKDDQRRIPSLKVGRCQDSGGIVEPNAVEILVQGN